LVFKAKRGHYRLVCELNHVYERVDYKNDRFAAVSKKKNNRSQKDYQNGDKDKTAICQSTLLVDYSGYNRLKHSGGDISHGKQNAYLRIRKTISKKINCGTRMYRAERREVRRIEQRISYCPKSFFGVFIHVLFLGTTIYYN
jgi:hypothetical protein